MHESSGHGYTITNRKNSKLTWTRKPKLGKEERKRAGSNREKSRNVFDLLDAYACKLELTFIPP